MNSVLVTFVSVAITVALSCMMGYAITRMKWRGSNAALGFLMLGMMVPIHATLIPLFLIMQKAGLLNTHWCIIIPYIAAGLPLAVFIISNFLRSIPHELEEAAFIDGCGVIKIVCTYYYSGTETGSCHCSYLHLHEQLERVYYGIHLSADF